MLKLLSEVIVFKVYKLNGLKIVPISLLTVVIILSSCATSDVNNKFNWALANQKCESAFENIPENQFGLQIASATQKLAGTAFSYTAAASGYAAQIFLDVSKSTGMVLGCTIVGVAFGPMGVPMAQSCVDGAFKNYETFRFGQEAYKKTSGFRCSNLRGLTKSVIKVSDCYANKITREGNQKALSYLKSLDQSPEYFNCLSEDLKNLISQKIKNLENLNEQ